MTQRPYPELTLNTVSGVSDGGAVNVLAQGTGGAGGGSATNETAGNNVSGGAGAAEILDNQISAVTTGAITMEQDATGGAGGAASGTGVLGAPGAGSSTLNYSNAQSFNHAALVTLKAVGVGGDGASYDNTGNTVTGTAGVGADGTAFTTVYNIGGPVEATADATGGDGGNANTVQPFPGANSGAGGAGVAVANAATTGGGHNVTVTSDAKGGNGGSVIKGNGATGAGGNAQATATGTAQGDSAVTVSADAYGGGLPFYNSSGPGGVGGNAVASGIGTSTGAGLLSVTAHAGGGYGTDGAVGGTALADATAIGLQQTVTATSSAEGPDVGVYAVAQTLTPAFAPALMTTKTEAFAAVGRQRSGARAAGETAAAYIDALPAISDAQQALATTPHAQAIFTRPHTNILGLVTLTGSADATYGQNTIISNSATSSEADFNLELLTYDHTPRDLLVGLLGASYAGAGAVRWQIIQNGTTVVDKMFANFSTAQTYFSDKTFDLGSISYGAAPGLYPIVSLQFKLTVSEVSANAGVFDPSIIFANAPAIPEPATLAFTALGALGLLRRRRRSAGRH